MTYLIEPYMFWQGHYRHYTLNLHNDRDTFLIYCDTHDNNIQNSKYIKAFVSQKSHFLGFMLQRIVNSMKAMVSLLEILIINRGQKASIHLIEFDPVSFLYCLMVNRNDKVRYILTVHSIERVKYSNKMKDAFSKLQRIIFNNALKKARQRGCHFVVHSNFHKRQLIQLIGEPADIRVIEYPSPDKISNNKKAFSKKLLIYGLAREDKGIFEFLQELVQVDLGDIAITVAGKILDNRINQFVNHKNIIIRDKYLSEAEISQLFEENAFLILPYPLSYTGGAGPLKDAMAHATPAICNSIPLFEDFVREFHVGYLYKSPAEIIDYLASLPEVEYRHMSERAVRYAQTYNWQYMKRQYEQIYEEVNL